MSAVLQEGLPRLGIDVDDDLISYLLELLEVEGIESCAEWLESASNCDDKKAARTLAEDAYATLHDKGNKEPSSCDESIEIDLVLRDNVDEVVKTLSANSGNNRTDVKWNGGLKDLSQLDNATKRDIVQKYACVEIQTLHLDEDGQFYSSGVSLGKVDDTECIPVNTNAARARQEQHELRLSQKQKHLEEQDRIRQQKLEKQRREEKEKLRCQKKERHK